MAQRYLFFNSVNDDRRIYQAQDFADYFGSVLSTGLLHEDNVPGLEVSVETGTMNTVVSEGRAIMRGHYYENTTPYVLTHSIAEPTADRIDRIVLRLDLRNAYRNILLHIKEGVPDSNPEPPALQRDAFIYELSLAQVRIRANTSTIDPSDVTDERLDDDVCGLVYSLLGNSYLQSQIDDIDSQLTQMTQKAHEVVTVGNNEDFETINEALEYLSKRHARYWQEGYTAEILLKSGFVMQEQVWVDSIDLSWITLSSEDAEVIINRSYLTEDRLGNDTYSAFTVRSGSLPIINVLFNMDNSGTSTNRHGVFVARNAKATILPYKGVKNAGEVGLRVISSSAVSADGAIFSNAGGIGIYASHASTVNAANVDVSGASVYGLYSTHVSVVNANSANARKGTSDSSDDIRVGQGGLINANGATGGTYVTPNTLTENGIIFK